MDLTIRPITSADLPTWSVMRQALWPGEVTAEDDAAELPDVLARSDHFNFIAEGPDGRPLAFIETALRAYANGCEETPVPFVEGLWVAPDVRRKRVAARLMDHVAAFFKSRGFSELCSDVLEENTDSQRAHDAWGFAETERVIYYRKPL